VTPEATAALFTRLRHLADTTRNGKMVLLPEGSVSRLDLLERRLLAAVKRANTPGPDRDGYSSGHPGMGGEDSSRSATEAAAVARLSGRPVRDEVREDALAAYRHLETAVNAIAELAMRLDKIDNRAKPESRHSNPGGQCLVCDRFVPNTEVDRLRRGMCSADYMAWKRSGRPVDIVEFRRLRAA
jgi:hypothetical protein